jgi:signal transduction histidine kinase
MKQLLPSAHADARVQDVGVIISESRLGQDAITALQDIAQRMLSSTGADLLAHALRRIFDVVPAAQRVTVVAWPPHPEEGFAPLLPEEALRREGIPASPVSMSMARHAVESRQALFFVGDAAEHEELRRAPSVLANRIKSAVYVPLMEAGDEVMALLCVDTPRPASPIRPDDFPFIRAVGALLSAALHADRIRQEAQRQEMAAREQEVRRDALANCLRIASHDLKSPLVVVQLAAQMLASAKDGGSRKLFLDQIKRAVHRSTRLINTYLEASEVLTGRTMAARKTQVDPHAVVDEEIEFLSSTRDDVQIENGVSCTALSADAEKLRQIFANLLGNAVKYGGKPPVVKVWSGEDPAGFLFHVSDNGVGISADDQRRLFQPFARVGDVRAAEGTGLGLWITQTLVRAHGGDIWVESAPGRGSTFSFRLPRD